MTKTELIKENERLEMELHNEQNRSLYWQRESDLYFNKLMKLYVKINDESILKFLENCTIVQKQQLEDFILTI